MAKKKKKSNMLFWIIVVAAIFLFLQDEKKTAVDEPYRYYCEGRDVWLEIYVPGDNPNDFFLNCEDYYPGEGKECGGASLWYATPQDPQLIAYRKCHDQDPPEGDADILYIGGDISECSAGSYDYCYHIFTDADWSAAEATYKWGYSDHDDDTLYPNIMFDWSCTSTDGPSGGDGGFVWRLSRYGTRMSCTGPTGSGFNCGPHHQDPDEQRFVREEGTDSGQVEITWNTLRDWGIDDTDSFYILSACYGQYYADFNWDYVFIHDRIRIPSDILENCDDDNPCGVKPAYGWQGAYDVIYQEHADSTDFVQQDVQQGGYCDNPNAYWDGNPGSGSHAVCPGGTCSSQVTCYWTEVYNIPLEYEYGIPTNELDSAIAKIWINGGYNSISIPETCLYDNPSHITLRGYSTAAGSGSCGSMYTCNVYADVECLGNGAWYVLATAGGGNSIQETGIEWKMKEYEETTQPDPITDGLTCINNRCQDVECQVDGDCGPDQYCEAGQCVGISCAADLFECPDGSFVPRVPPDCEFAPCPDPVTLSDLINAISDWIGNIITRQQLGEIIMDWANG